MQSDLEFERYRTPRPDGFWALITNQATGLEPPQSFGPTVPANTGSPYPMLDAVRFNLGQLPEPPEVAILGVPDSLGIVRARSTTAPIVVAGDAEGLLELAGAGLLDPTVPCFSRPRSPTSNWRPQSARAQRSCSPIATGFGRGAGRPFETISASRRQSTAMVFRRPD
ncbi:MAG: hypothetical protein R2706_17425 [Acidimicrobiales bacterium]